MILGSSIYLYTEWDLIVRSFFIRVRVYFLNFLYG